MYIFSDINLNFNFVLITESAKISLYDRETEGIPVKLWKVGVFNDNLKTDIIEAGVTHQTELAKSAFVAASHA